MLCCLVVFVGTASAAAQAAPRARSQSTAQKAGDDQAEYGRLIREALVEVRAENWAEARALFLKAHALAPSARSLRGLGITSFELRHYVQAIREFQEALADTRSPLTEEQRKEAREVIARAQAFVGTVKVRLEPAGATLLVDMEETRERELLLDLGDYELRARAPGYHERVQQITVQGGQVREVKLLLTPLPATTAANGRAAEPQLAPKVDGASPVDRGAEDEGGILSQWWFWTGVGVVVAGGVAAGVILATGDDRATPPEAGDVGGVLEALERAR